MSDRRSRGLAVMTNANFVHHPFLRFQHPTYTPATRTDYHESMLTNLGQQIEAPLYLDWDDLERITDDQGELAGDTLRAFTTQTYYLPSGHVGFTCHAWERLFRISEPIYRELVIEFFSTLALNSTVSDIREVTIGFQLGGVPRRMSLVDFSIAVGLYTLAETRDIHFDSFMAVADREMYDGVTEAAIHWPTVGNGDFSARNPPASWIRDPQHRLLHRLIALSISARRESPEKVTRPDLFYLIAMVERRIVDIPWLLVNWMRHKASGTRLTSSICGGQYVTRIARYFEILTPEVIHGLTLVVPGMEMMTLDDLVRYGMVGLLPAMGRYGESAHWTRTLALGEIPAARAGAAAGGRGAGRAAGGRARGRGRAPVPVVGGHDELMHTLGQMRLESQHNFGQLRNESQYHWAHQESMMHQMMDHYQLPYQPMEPYLYQPYQWQPYQQDEDQDED